MDGDLAKALRRMDFIFYPPAKAGGNSGGKSQSMNRF